MPFAKTEPASNAAQCPTSDVRDSTAPSEVAPPVERSGTGENGASGKSGEDSGKSKDAASERQRAERIIRDIGIAFNQLRKRGRSAAWASLEDKVSEAGHILIATGMITAKDWVGMMIDIEQFRKAEGGSEELPGDALAKWLSEPEKKAKVKAN